MERMAGRRTLNPDYSDYETQIYRILPDGRQLSVPVLLIVNPVERLK
jgi:hypothetical protein